LPPFLLCCSGLPIHTEPVFDSEQSSEFRGLSICDKDTISINYLITKPTAGCSEVSKSRGVMKQPRCKMLPTRDDLATAWKMIRDRAYRGTPRKPAGETWVKTAYPAVMD